MVSGCEGCGQWEPEITRSLDIASLGRNTQKTENEKRRGFQGISKADILRGQTPPGDSDDPARRPACCMRQLRLPTVSDSRQEAKSELGPAKRSRQVGGIFARKEGVERATGAV